MMPVQSTIVITTFIVKTETIGGKNSTFDLKTRGQLLPYCKSFLKVYACSITLKI